MRGYAPSGPNNAQTGTDYSTIGLHSPYFACRPILYSLVNRFLFRADPHSSSEAGYTRKMARQEQVFLAPRCNRAPSVYSSRCFDSTLNDFSRSSRLPDLDNTSCKTPSTRTEFYRIRFRHPTIPSTSSGLYHRCGRRTTPTRGRLYRSYSCARYPRNGEGQS